MRESLPQRASSLIPIQLLVALNIGKVGLTEHARCGRGCVPPLACLLPSSAPQHDVSVLTSMCGGSKVERTRWGLRLYLLPCLSKVPVHR